MPNSSSQTQLKLNYIQSNDFNWLSSSPSDRIDVFSELRNNNFRNSVSSRLSNKITIIDIGLNFRNENEGLRFVGYLTKDRLGSNVRIDSNNDGVINWEDRIDLITEYRDLNNNSTDNPVRLYLSPTGLPFVYSNGKTFMQFGVHASTEIVGGLSILSGFVTVDYGANDFPPQKQAKIKLGQVDNSSSNYTLNDGKNQVIHTGFTFETGVNTITDKGEITVETNIICIVNVPI